MSLDNFVLFHFMNDEHLTEYCITGSFGVYLSWRFFQKNNFPVFILASATVSGP